MSGHPFWCGGDGTMPLDCHGPDHPWHLGLLVGTAATATLVLAQPGDSPQLSLIGEDGPLLVLTLDQLHELAFLTDEASVMGRGDWPEYRVP